MQVVHSVTDSLWLTTVLQFILQGQFSLRKAVLSRKDKLVHKYSFATSKISLFRAEQMNPTDGFV